MIPFLKKCFENVNSIEFKPGSPAHEIIALSSSEKERIALTQVSIPFSFSFSSTVLVVSPSIMCLLLVANVYTVAIARRTKLASRDVACGAREGDAHESA